MGRAGGRVLVTGALTWQFGSVTLVSGQSSGVPSPCGAGQTHSKGAKKTRKVRLCLKTLDSDVATVARPWASSVLSQLTHALASVATSFKGFQTKPSGHAPAELLAPRQEGAVPLALIPDRVPWAVD